LERIFGAARKPKIKLDFQLVAALAVLVGT
jgi:hypothetical protein